MKVVTVVGQGYVGLPLAQAAAESGWKVYGYDVNKDIVSSLNNGNSHVDDLSDEDVGTMLQQGYEATNSEDCFKKSDVIVICVPTPLSEDGSPDLRAVKEAVGTVGHNLVSGTLVILESTTYPGTTEEICLPILEQESGLRGGSDFNIAFSPERVDPGSEKFGIKNTPKLVGGVGELATKQAFDFYSNFVDQVVPLKGAKEAETAKLLENTFRHINIALVNEMAKLCHELDIDIWEVIRGAATKPFGFMKFTPGPGVGGHCIPIDPKYLSYEVNRKLGYPFRFVELAQEINNTMPRYIVQRIAEILNEDTKSIKASKILLLGVTYKPNIADQRESPSKPIAKLLIKDGADVSYYDPYVKTWDLGSTTIQSETDLIKAVKSADLVVLLQNHDVIREANILSVGTKVFDTRGVLPEPAYRL